MSIVNRKQINNTYSYYLHLCRVDEDFTYSGYDWLLKFDRWLSYSDCRHERNKEFSLAQQKFLRSKIEQILSNHVEEVEVIRERNRRDAYQYLRVFREISQTLGGPYGRDWF